MISLISERSLKIPISPRVKVALITLSSFPAYVFWIYEYKSLTQVPNILKSEYIIIAAILADERVDKVT